MARINITRVVKRQLAALLIDLMDGAIDDKAAAVELLRDLANEIEGAG